MDDPNRGDSLAAVKRTRSLYRKLDPGYGCFAVVALAAAGCGVLTFLPFDAQTNGGYQFLFGVPLVMIMLGAMAAGTVFAVINWREWPLLVMALTCIVTTVLVGIGVERQSVSDRAITAGVLAAAGILAFFTVQWFAIARNRMKTSEAVQDRKN